MFNRKRDTFLGMENVPDHPEGYVREDSPRRHAVRNTPGSREHTTDRLLGKLTPRLVRDQAGTVFEIPGHAPLKEGWVVVGPVPEKPATHRMVTDPKGNVHRHHRAMPLKPGWQEAGPCERDRKPADIDVPQDIGDGETMTQRDQLQGELARQAREIRVGPYRTGRRLNMLSEGEGIVDEIADDRSIATPHGKRVADLGTPFIKTPGEVVSPEQIGKALANGQRHWCATCGDIVEKFYRPVRKLGGHEVRVACHTATATAWIPDSRLEDAPTKRIIWFALDPRLEFSASKIDRHGRCVGAQDSTLARVRAVRAGGES